MEGEEGSGGPRLSKRFNGGKPGTGEVDYKTKSGTAWSHNFLNQKPWHPLSYPNQRRKWIAEQSDAHHQRRADEVAREYAQEQEFFRQTALVSSKEKEKMEMMQAVSFMYVRPPGYNAESAKAAEVSDEKRKEEHENPASVSQAPADQVPSSSAPNEKKSRPKDVFGRFLPTEEEFSVLKGAPRLETGAPARVKPFAIEIRNVRCVRCGNFGHQSGDRECPLKDAIMPNEESRLKRDDPLTTMMANMDPTEPLKWELKQKPGLSPPRGGFDPDDPNQQIVAEEIFDEYGGFLGDGNVPELLANFSPGKLRKKAKQKKRRRESSPSRDSRTYVEKDYCSHSDREDRRSRSEKRKKRNKDRMQSLSGSDSPESDRHYRRRSRHSSSADTYSDKKHGRRKNKHSSHTDKDLGSERRHSKHKGRRR